MAISQIFKGNKSGSKDYTLSDMADKIGVNSKELPIITNFAKTIGGIAKWKSLDPEIFANEMKIVNAEFRSFFSKLDPTSINKQVASMARKVGKLDNLLNQESLSTKNVKIIYKAVQSVIDSLIKIIKDVTVGDYIGLSKDATNLFIEMKAIFKILVEGLTKIKKCISENLNNNVDGLKIKIFKADNEFKNDIKKLKDIVKKDVESARLEFKNDSTKITEWFNKIFTELDKRVTSTKSNIIDNRSKDKSDIKKNNSENKTTSSKIEAIKKANNFDDTSQSKKPLESTKPKINPDTKKQYMKFEDLKLASKQEEIPKVDYKSIKQKMKAENDEISGSLAEPSKRLSLILNKELSEALNQEFDAASPLKEFDNSGLFSNID